MTPIPPVGPIDTSVVLMNDGWLLSKYIDTAGLSGDVVIAFTPTNNRDDGHDKIIGFSIYIGMIISVDAVNDALLINSVRETSTGLGEKTPFASCAYNVHCKKMLPGTAVRTQICISHFPGGITVLDKTLSIIANWISLPL